jgi:hypothetical protein
MRGSGIYAWKKMPSPCERPVLRIPDASVPALQYVSEFQSVGESCLHMYCAEREVDIITHQQLDSSVLASESQHSPILAIRRCSISKFRSFLKRVTIFIRYWRMRMAPVGVIRKSTWSPVTGTNLAYELHNSKEVPLTDSACRKLGGSYVTK